MKVQYKLVHQDKMLTYRVIKTEKIDNLYLYYCICDDKCEKPRKYVIFSSYTDYKPKTHTLIFTEYYDVDCEDKFE